MGTICAHGSLGLLLISSAMISPDKKNIFWERLQWTTTLHVRLVHGLLKVYPYIVQHVVV